MAAFLFIFFFCGSASATTYNITNPQSIQQYINNAQPGDTISLASGTYNQHNIVVNKSLTITGPVTSGSPSAVINARQKSVVFTINSGVNVTLKYLTITNGSTFNNGGGILNYGNLTMTHCYITHNTAKGVKGGGGIWNNGIMTVSGSYISSNSASKGYGGGIYNSGASTSMTMTGCHINSNTATNGSGGGIYNFGASLIMKNSYIYRNVAKFGGGGIDNYDGKLIVSSCDFGLNKATGAASSDGNAIMEFTFSTTILHFNRFHDPYTGHEICSRSMSSTINAKYNWWGSNANPNSKVSGNVIVTPWLVLKATANPTSVNSNNTSVITANLWHDSNGVYHNPNNGHLLNGLTIAFTATLGKITSQASIVNGAAKNSFTSGTTKGKATVSIKLNNQTIYTYITIS